MTSARGDSLLRRHCGGCHADPEADVPRFDFDALDPSLALRGVKEVLSEQMPPTWSGARLQVSERAAIAEYLCTSTGRERSECAGLVEPSGTVVLGGSSFLSALGVQAQDGPGLARQTFVKHVRPAVPYHMVDATSIATSVSIALEECSKLPKQAQEACVDNIIELSTTPIGQPAGDGGESR